jgi:hypothetical protein
MNDREVMQMALNALTEWDARGRLRVIEALRTALAQPDVPETDCGNIAQPNLVESQPIEDEDEPEQAYCPHGKVEGRYCHDCGVIEQAEMRGEL